MPDSSIELSLVPVAAPGAGAGTTAAATPVAPAWQARALGPGWFDSSFELHHGLDVRETWSDDDRLLAWVDAFFAAQRPADGGDSSSAT